MVTAVTSGPAGTQPLVTLTYSYDNVGNRTSMTDSLTNTGRTTYVYDAANRLTTLSRSFGSTAGPQVVFGYDPGGRLTTMTRTIGASSYFTTTITYDLVNRVTAINNFIGGGRMVITYGNYGYDYDAASRVTGAGGPGFNLGYTYNADNELTNAAGTLNGSSVNVTYAYDSAGNRNSTGYTNGTGDEQSASPGYTYSYDNDGNLISETNTSTSITTTYTYDFRNRLTNVEVGGTVVATYVYDALNRRIGIDDNGSQTWTVYDGTNAYADFNGSGTLKDRYLYGPAVDELLARTSSGGDTAWYISDKDGSVQVIYDASAGVVDTIIYDSFGQVVTETGASYGDRFKYAGMEYDSAIQIYYDQARNYNPATGRFLQQDPLGLAAGDVNVYRYVFNEPTNLIDPSGLKPAYVDGSGMFRRRLRLQPVQAIRRPVIPADVPVRAGSMALGSLLPASAFTTLPMLDPDRSVDPSQLLDSSLADPSRAQPGHCRRGCASNAARQWAKPHPTTEIHGEFGQRQRGCPDPHDGHRWHRQPLPLRRDKPQRRKARSAGRTVGHKQQQAGVHRQHGSAVGRTLPQGESRTR